MLEFLKNLVSTDTNANEAKNYSECAKLIAKEAKALGFGPKIYDANSPDKKPRPNVIVNMDNGAEKTLLINAHYDVVPAGEGWETDPFEMKIKNKRIYGRGTSDDKGAIAASLYAVSESKPKVNMQFAYTCDEEIGGKYGLGYLVKEKLVKADAALILDGSPAATAASSGVVMGKLHFRGKAGHAGKPFEADNPVPKMIIFLNELKNYSKIREKSHSPYFGLNKKRIFGRFSITTLKGSEKENIIPEEAVAGFDLRINPGEKMENVLAEFKNHLKIVTKKTGISPELKIIGAHNGYESKGKFVEKMKRITNTDGNYGTWGGNDGHHTAHLMETACFGPSSASNNIHVANEFVKIKDLEYVKSIVKRIAEQGW